eukprot:scaffold11885_cov219-Skeletonema_marinoi.AAC.1
MIERLTSLAAPAPSPGASVVSTRADPPPSPLPHPSVNTTYTGGGGGDLSMSTVRTVESESPASVTTVEQVQSPVQLPTVEGGAVYYDTPVRDAPAEQSLAAA